MSSSEGGCRCKAATADMCVNMCAEVRVDICAEVCVDMRADMCFDICADMCLDMSAGMSAGMCEIYVSPGMKACAPACRRSLAGTFGGVPAVTVTSM